MGTPCREVQEQAQLFSLEFWYVACKNSDGMCFGAYETLSKSWLGFESHSNSGNAPGRTKSIRSLTCRYDYHWVLKPEEEAAKWKRKKWLCSSYNNGASFWPRLTFVISFKHSKNSSVASVTVSKCWNLNLSSSSCASALALLTIFRICLPLIFFLQILNSFLSISLRL